MLAGLAVKKHISSLISVDEIVRVKLVSQDMYCRFDGDIELCINNNTTTLATYLLEKRYAKPYKGKKKEDWDSEILQHIITELK